ncbi:glycosyltransferase [Luteibacter jiangsuensis]
MNSSVDQLQKDTNQSRMQVDAVVVTYNRRILLEKCLIALLAQEGLGRIFLIDNASTDDTNEWFLASPMAADQRVVYRRMESNGGGAGGFASGMALALDSGADWLWMMDDDAEPLPGALSELLALRPSPENVYGSLAVQGESTAWTTTLLGPPRRAVDRVEEVPECTQVLALPFLGFLIHAALVQRIGLPDSGYFIAADDVEYCLRAEAAGAKIFIAGHSRITHPKADRYHANVLGRKLTCLSLPPWKRYYDTRNRLLIARKYYGVRFFTSTVPGSFVRLFAALAHEPQRAAQLRAFMAGFFDGLLGRKGMRHQRWRIS